MCVYIYIYTYTQLYIHIRPYVLISNRPGGGFGGPGSGLGGPGGGFNTGRSSGKPLLLPVLKKPPPGPPKPLPGPPKPPPGRLEMRTYGLIYREIRKFHVK